MTSGCVFMFYILLVARYRHIGTDCLFPQVNTYV